MSHMGTSVEMDLYKVANNYIEKVLSADTDKDRSIRVLILDRHTAPIISLVSTQSDLLKREIYLVDRLENDNRDKLRNLKCVCFLKPSDHTITKLSQEIGNPRYSGYEVYFNNLITKSRLERLAESDDLEVINKVVEVFQDYYVLNRALYSAPEILNPYSMKEPQSWDPLSLESSLQSLTSLILSLNMKPIIKYEKNSKMAGKLATALNYEINSNSQLFDHLEPKMYKSPLVLIMDRKNDPITPLLFPWTYQSMVNELLGINNANNTVDLSHLSGVGEELKTVIMNENQDPFYSKCMYRNFGDLSTLLKQYVDDYKTKTKTNSNISSIKDMKFFLENYPEYKKMSLNLSKHMLLTSEIDKQINGQRIWETSEFEQNMCSSADTSHHDQDLEELKMFLGDIAKPDGSDWKPLDDMIKLKLLSLYALKYESYPNNQINAILKSSNKPIFNKFIPVLLKYAGQRSRAAGEDGAIFNKVGSPSGAANHVAALFNNFSEKLVKSRVGLSGDTFVNINNSVSESKVAPSEIVIFMVGGVCYEEARIIDEINQNTDDVRIVIGGTHTLNSKSFINNLMEIGGSW